ncbi:MAG: LiaF-related protein [Atribacterota bacterium]|nr:LiaF-related protein [Atribacterota bacterium]
MRMFGGVFMGVIFLTVGMILLLNTFFNFNINIFKLTIGILIILFGVFILFNGFGFQDSGNIVFREGIIRVSEVQDEYNIIFSSGTVDLSKVKIEDKVKKIAIHTIFAEGKVILNSDIPTLIRASSAFGELELPDRSSVIFSSQKYRIGDISADKGYLEIEANAVFGKLKFITIN